MTRRSILACLLLLLPVSAAAQTIGTFRWQTQPFCNVITVTVTQLGGMYRLEGADNQCGNPTRASAIGTAFPNPDGTIGIGLTIIASPAGSSVHIDATISPGTGFSGTWRDDGGRTGAFVLTAGGGTGGQPRPLLLPMQGFVHVVTLANSAGHGDCTILEHPLIENQPDVVVQVTHEIDEVNNSYLPAPLSVKRIHSRWYICVDGPAGPPPVGTRFHVVVLR